MKREVRFSPLAWMPASEGWHVAGMTHFNGVNPFQFLALPSNFILKSYFLMPHRVGRGSLNSHFITEKSVQKIIDRCKEKLSCETRTGLVVKSIREGLIFLKECAVIKQPQNNKK